MSITPEYIDELLSRISLSDVIAKRVKLVRKGNRMSGLCPFHNEKTPSFYVNDIEGFYHCFGCSANGDAISFLRETEGLDFVEAVSQLSAMAGMTMPQFTPQDKQAVQRQRTTLELFETAAQHFCLQLGSEAGEQAQSYLRGRDLKDETIQEFRLGFASYSGLFENLQQREFPPDLIQRVGLIGRSDRDNGIYDYFRNRIMFPIENRKGQVIAFGARAMGDAQPKYLNSPDGPSFSKKSVVYGWTQARARINKGLPLMVVEGYMDVIAISASGVAAALAPLGTALTEQQIQLVWKLHKEPILCFDGDKAGQKAAIRALERCLPLIEPGKNVRFAHMPEGQDPDDLLKTEGPEGLQRVLSAALGIADMLWQSKLEEHGLDGAANQPTQRAAFWSELRRMGKMIVHNQTRTAFLDDIEYRIATMRASFRQPSGTSRYPQFQQPRRKRPQTGKLVQHKAILAIMVAFPELFGKYAEPFMNVEMDNEALFRVKNAIISQIIATPDLDADAIRHHLEMNGHKDVLDELFNADMQARFGMSVDKLSTSKADGVLAELLARAS